MKPARSTDDTLLDAPRVSSGLQAALETVRRWRQDAEREHDATLQRLTEEAAAIASRMETIQAEMEENEAARNAARQERDRLDHDHDQRLHDALISAFQRDARTLDHRAHAVSKTDAIRRRALEEALRADPEMERLANEENRFAEVDLDSLPPSYQDAISAHHKAQSQRLRAFLASHDPGTATSETLDPLGLDVAWTARDDGDVVRVTALMPIDASSRDPAADAPQLSTTVLARVLEAFQRAAGALGSPAARVHTVEVDGLAGLHLTLSARAGADVDALVERTLGEVFSAAPELEDAAIVLCHQRVGVDPLEAPVMAEPTDEGLVEELLLEDDDDS